VNNRRAYRILVRNPEGKRPLGRSSCRWVDNIKRALKVGELGDMDWIDLAQNKDQLPVL
jgi:hypothetical protein